MPTLFDRQDRDAVMRRLSTLQPASPRQWGKMTMPQMMAHCAATLEVACGDTIQKQRFIGRVLAPIVKRSVLGEKPLGRNAPTDPSYRIVDDRDFAKERERLTTLIDRFGGAGEAAANGRVHSFFGRLTGDEWGRLMYKHLDHHLRQFSA